jgi:MoaA/NifB/PqqE/SkfB family radical SAM enzyme
MVILDITNLCNLKCIHCPQPQLQAQPGFKAAFLAWEHYVRIIDELADTGEPVLVRFVGDGEPLLHPKIMEMVEYAAPHGNIVTNLTTNGLLLDDKAQERLLNAKVALIDISIDALTKPVYEAVRRGGNYQKLMRNVFGLLARIRKTKAVTKTMVSFISQNENAEEAEWFGKYWEPLADYVMIRSLHSAAGQVKIGESRERNLAGSQERYPCPHLWKRLTVDFDGRIKYCAHDWGTGSTLANIANKSLGEVWRGEALGALRKEQVENRYLLDSICGPCTDWASTKWDYGYERLIDKVVFGGKPCLYPGK